MVYALLGLFVLVGGWWTTGAFFSAYRQLVHRELSDARRRGTGEIHRHHFGAGLLVLLDFGVVVAAGLLLGRSHWLGSHDCGDASCLILRWGAVPALLASVCFCRIGRFLVQLYYDRWRAITGPTAHHPRPRSPWSHLWSLLSPTGRCVLVVAGLAAIAGATHGTWHLLAVHHGRFEPAADPRLLLLPPTLVALVLVRPLWRVRRLARVPVR